MNGNKTAPLLAILLATLLLCQGCNKKITVSITDKNEEALVEIEAPEHTPIIKKTPLPTPSPTIAPTEQPTEKPTEQPTEKPTAKPVEKTEKPKKTPELTEKAQKTEKPANNIQSAASAGEPVFVQDDSATLMPVIDNGADSAISTILQLTNQQRTANGLGTLKKSSALMSAADTRAKEISVSFSHTRPNGSSALDISSAAYAENIAYGMNIPHTTIMDGWMNSPGHRANILNGSYATIGIGFYSTNGYNYYVQLFGY